MREAIDWCKGAYTGYRNFAFFHADIYNSQYNSKGKINAKDFIFPYGDNLFDLVLLTSVFTHMLPEEVRHYMGEISRVLKRGGRSIVTYFLLNPESLLSLERGKPFISMPFSLSDECRVANLNIPEAAVGLDESFVCKLYLERTQRITEIRYGYWCGRSILGEFQDLIIAMKE